MRPAAVDATGYVRGLLEQALWSLRYHEVRLVRAHRNLKFARDFMRRADLPIELADEEEDEDEDEDEDYRSIEEYAADVLRQALWSVTHHEKELEKAHIEMAHLRSVLARGGYEVEELGEAAIVASVKERLGG